MYLYHLLSEFSGSKELYLITNHPSFSQQKYLPPTAMIPFCKMGGNMSVMGMKIDQLNFPVCNSFRPKIIRDQLCYQVDPNKYKDKIDLKGELSLSIFIDFNEDRELSSIQESTMKGSVTLDAIGNERNVKKSYWY